MQIEIKELRDILMSFCNAYAPKEAPKKEKKLLKLFPAHLQGAL